MTTTKPGLGRQKSRIPFDDLYVQELGAAVYIFGYLEWGVVCCIEHFETGYASNPHKGMARNIAEKFVAVVKRSTSLTSDARLAAEAASKRFLELIDDRNRLIHGNPYSSASSAQQLLYNGKSGWKEWSVVEVQTIAKKFEDVAIEVNDLFHKHLASI